MASTFSTHAAKVMNKLFQHCYGLAVMQTCECGSETSQQWSHARQLYRSMAHNGVRAS